MLQIVEAFACHRRDLHQIEIVLLAPAGEFLKFFGVRHIDFRGDDDFGFFRKGRIVFGEFGINGVEFVDGITTAHTGHVDQVKQHTSAFDMLQELNSEAMAKMSAFNEAGNIRNDERSIGVHRNDAEMGFERRKRIVRDFWTGGRDARDQCRFPDVRIADQPHVREQLQF